MEVLMAIVILGIISVIASTIFFTSIKGSNKTTAINNIKQNGSYAMDIMTRMIRNARSVGVGGSYVSLVNPDKGVTTFMCGDNNGDGLLDIASNSGFLSSVLISATTVPRIEIENCDEVFALNSGEPGVYPDVVTINFTLQQTEVYAAEGGTMTFVNSVSLRNY